jgi:hypothetical protein
MRPRPRLTYSNIVATLCLIAVAGGSALAATKPSSPTISGCVVKKGKKAGSIRILSGKKKCKKSERKLAWNQKGVPGAAGPAGTAGAAGVAGATGPAGAAGADAVAPAGAVMFFALATCPAGWTEYTAAQGRYVVGMPPGGTLEKTDGSALSDGEDRPVGQHSHGVTDPGHTHGVSVDPILVGGNVTPTRSTGTAHNTSVFTLQTDLAFTGIAVDPAGAVAGTNAPYVQLLACRKS